MPMSGLIKFALQFIEITLGHGCSLVTMLHVLRTPYPWNTPGWILL